MTAIRLSDGLGDEIAMIVRVFEVYSEGGSNCVMFLTEQEAKDQSILVPSTGPYPANVEMGEKEYEELKQNRYAWA